MTESTGDSLNGMSPVDVLFKSWISVKKLYIRKELRDGVIQKKLSTTDSHPSFHFILSFSSWPIPYLSLEHLIHLVMIVSSFVSNHLASTVLIISNWILTSSLITSNGPYLTMLFTTLSSSSGRREKKYIYIFHIYTIKNIWK